MTIFFETREYKTFIKISERLTQKATLKNVILYWKYGQMCLEMMKEYNHIGFDEEENRYRWWPEFKIAEEEYSYGDARRVIRRFGDDCDSMIKELSK